MRTQAIVLLALLLPLQAAPGAANRPNRSSDSGALSVDELSSRPRVTQEEFLRLLDRSVSGHAPESFAACVEELETRGLLSRGFRASPGRLVTREDAALPFARYLGFEGGLSGRVFGLGRRSARQELVYRGIMTEGPPSFYMTGAELVGALDRARQYKAQREVSR